jgi:sensor histidine kinase YesM
MNMITWIAVGLLIVAAALFSIIASWWIMRQLKSEAESNVRKMLLESENQNLKKTELMVKSELKMLQAQMNPHFLFNTLSMISQLATMGRSEEAAELIDITAYLLRYSMDKSNRMSTLREEIECVRSYLHIQRLRFGDRITFELNVEEALPNIMLPGMILQPLIENAVLHGVDGVLKGAVVSVSSERRENSLRLSVEDNGRGMSGERLEEIMSSDSFDGDEHVHIGLLNVKKRIEMLFGESASFHIESTEDVGTLVTITIDIASNAGEGNV